MDGIDERKPEEDAPSVRSEAQRDCDRILYSSALQRLGGITQVSAPEVGHNFHTRLTHSMKVAQVAKRLAERLKAAKPNGAARRITQALDPDAAEAAALAHDLGHPPFGHLAEKELNERAKGHGGFEGNAQSFRIVTRLALRDSADPGLNLTRRTLNGVLKYPWVWDPHDEKKSKKWGAYVEDDKRFHWVRRGFPDDELSLEARIMDWSDDVTYAVHDIDDFFRAGLVPLDRLCTSETELNSFVAYLQEKHPDDAAELTAAARRLFEGTLNIPEPYEGSAEDRVNLRVQGSALITRYINDVTLTNDPAGGIAYFEVDDDLAHEVRVLKELTWRYVIENPALAILQRGQRRIIEDLFDRYIEAIQDDELRLFPAAVRERLRYQAKTESARVRVVVDLIAGLTEPAAEEIYRRMGGVVSGSVLMPAGRLT